MHALGIREPSFLHSRRIARIRRRPTTRSSGAGRGLARSQTLSSGGSGSRSSPAARSLYGRRGRRARPWRRGRSAGTRAHLPTSWRTGGWARSSRDIAEPSPRERGVTWRQCQCSTPPRRLRRSDSRLFHIQCFTQRPTAGTHSLFTHAQAQPHQSTALLRMGKGYHLVTQVASGSPLHSAPLQLSRALPTTAPRRQALTPVWWACCVHSRPSHAARTMTRHWALSSRSWRRV